MGLWYPLLVPGQIQLSSKRNTSIRHYPHHTFPRLSLHNMAAASASTPAKAIVGFDKYALFGFDTVVVVGAGFGFVTAPVTRLAMSMHYNT